jgi:hypothetical protein
LGKIWLWNTFRLEFPFWLDIVQTLMEEVYCGKSLAIESGWAIKVDGRLHLPIR